MAERLSSEQMKQLKEDMNVMNAWSWSRYNSSKTDLYGYLLHYLLHIPSDQVDSIYGSMGGCVHDLLENIYEGNITRSEAISKYKDMAMELDVLGQQFDRKDEDANEKIGNKYHYSNLNFLENFKTRDGYYAKLEEFVTISVGKQLLIGYIDYNYITEDGLLYIEDFKTSSIYTGDKILKEEGQLLLYSLAKIQQGYNIENIRAGWFFTKYVTITFQMKNGKERVSNVMRCDIGSKVSASAKSWLTDKKSEITYSDIEVNAYLDELMESNDISVLPKHIQEKFKIEDCFVSIDITQEKIDSLVEDIRQQIFKLTKLEMEYNKTKDDTLFWTDINKSNEYFFHNLCGYSRKLHKPFDEYLLSKDVNNINKEDDDDLSIYELMLL